MFWKKKTPQIVEPVYLKNDKGTLVGVRMGEKEFRLAAYDLMMCNNPGQKIIYMYDKLGNKVAWDIRSFEELDNMLRTSFQPQ